MKMKPLSLTLLGLAILAGILLIVVYAQLPPPVFWGTVTVDGSPGGGAEVTAWVDGELRGQDTATLVGGSALYSMSVSGSDADNGATITFNVSPSANPNSYEAATAKFWMGGSNLTNLVINPGGEPTTCEVGADCSYCVGVGSGWDTKTRPRADCSSPYDNCVINQDGVGAYDWACCGDRVTNIFVY